MGKTNKNFDKKDHIDYAEAIQNANQAIHRMESSIIQINVMIMNIEAYRESTINKIIKDATDACCKMIASTNDVRDTVQECFYVYGDEGDIPKVYGDMLIGQYKSITNSTDKLLEQFTLMSSKLRCREIAKRSKSTDMGECTNSEAASEDKPTVQSAEHPIETETLPDQEPQLNAESVESEKHEGQKNE